MTTSPARTTLIAIDGHTAYRICLWSPAGLKLNRSGYVRVHVIAKHEELDHKENVLTDSEDTRDWFDLMLEIKRGQWSPMRR